jgi:glycerate kinase
MAPARPAASPAGSSGFDAIADEVQLFDRIEGADLVITGEGLLDEQSFDGKVVGGVAGMAAEADVPVVAVVGHQQDGVDVRGVEVISLSERFGEDRARAATLACIREVTRLTLARR